ncbi:lysozyme [Xanthobacteraceae bacterium Astr-EGSB]|uniref:lysozyme n=1 Tax=Astrobacterium formosum TaxID=3069710 RepID=UPI0027B3B207|nr:lysozyme [Xanthobacteraceae bacterium Astr-EGSB]
MLQTVKKHPGKSATAAAVMMAAAAFITPWEGVRLTTYKDIVGVDTVCIGETDKAAVAEGKRRAYTPTECRDMLVRRLPDYDTGFMRCVTRADIPVSVHVAGISLAYNVGTGAVCKSTFVRLVNAGDFAAACDALLMFNRAGGRVVKGLDNRRRAERDYCLAGLRGRGP